MLTTAAESTIAQAVTSLIPQTYFSLASEHLNSLNAHPEHREWYGRYDDADFVGSDEIELLLLLATAPTDMARGIMFGKISALAEFEMTTTHTYAVLPELTGNENIDMVGTYMSCVGQIKKLTGEWGQDYEDTQFSLATTGELITMMNTAPNDFMAGVVYGKASVFMIAQNH